MKKLCNKYFRWKNIKDIYSVCAFLFSIIKKRYILLGSIWLSSLLCLFMFAPEEMNMWRTIHWILFLVYLAPILFLLFYLFVFEPLFMCEVEK